MNKTRKLRGTNIGRKDIKVRKKEKPEEAWVEVVYFGGDLKEQDWGTCKGRGEAEGNCVLKVGLIKQGAHSARIRYLCRNLPKRSSTIMGEHFGLIWTLRFWPCWSKVTLGKSDSLQYLGHTCLWDKEFPSLCWKSAWMRVSVNVPDHLQFSPEKFTQGLGTGIKAVTECTWTQATWRPWGTGLGQLGKQ